jgi:RHS repeat-associated protein
MLDAASGLYYNRARWYDSQTGRFNRLDPFFGDLQDPQSLHKYLYAGADPVTHSDPSGRDFNVASMLSASGISNMIQTGVGYVSTAFRVYNFASKLLQLLEYAKLAVRVLRALHASTPEGAAAALVNELKNQVGDFNPQAIIQGFQAAMATIQPHWQSIGNEITNRADQIGKELAPRLAPRVPMYLALQAVGKLKLVFFLPTGPGGRVADNLVSVSRNAEVAISPMGGRLFGFGLTTPERARRRDYDQLFRIDYYDGEVLPPLRVHYHLLGDSKRDGHDRTRTIWQLWS